MVARGKRAARRPLERVQRVSFCTLKGCTEVATPSLWRKLSLRPFRGHARFST